MKARIFPILAVLLAAILWGCILKSERSSNEPDISLRGKVLNRDGTPVPGVVATLRLAGISDTTDSQGAFHIKGELPAGTVSGAEALLKAASVRDTVTVITKEGQLVDATEIDSYVDVLPDLFIVQRDIYGDFLSISGSVADIEAALTGDGIDAPRIVPIGYNAANGSFSGFFYVKQTGTVNRYAVVVNVYDTSGALIGRSDTVEFDSRLGNVAIPAFRPTNVVPVVRLQDDTASVNDTLLVRGAVVAAGRVETMEFSIGGGPFVPASSPETTIVLPPAEDLDYRVVLRVEDEHGNIVSDTGVIQVELDPPVAVLTVPDTVDAESLFVLDASGSYDRLGSIAQYEWSIGEPGNFIPASGPDTSISAPAFPQDSIRISLRVTDDDSGSITVTRTVVVVDRTPPLAPNVKVPVSPTADQTPTWAWVPGGGGGSGNFRYKLNNADLTSGSDTTSDSSFTPAGDLEEGVHTLYVQERDKAGNWSASHSASVTIGNSIVTLDTVGISGEWAAISVPSDGLPVISYRDYTSGVLKLAKCGDVSCSSGNTITTLHAGGGLGYKPSVFTPPGNTPVIGYYANKDLMVVKCGNSTCSSGNTTTMVDSAGDVGHSPTVSASSDGLPVISYYDASNRDLKVVKCGDAACSNGNTIASVARGNAEFPSISVPSDGLPIISYGSGITDPLYVVKCGNASCSSGNSITTLDSNMYLFSSISVPSDGLPVISYFDGAALKVAKCGNASCSSGNSVTTVDAAGEAGWQTSIFVPSDGLPVISYLDYANRGLKVAKCGDASCSSGNTITRVDAGEDLGWFSSISVPSDGLPVISYFDGANGTVKVVKCAKPDCTRVP